MVRLNEVELFVTDVGNALHLYRDVIGVPLEGHAHAEGDPVHYHANWGSGSEFLLFTVYEALPQHQETRTSVGFVVTGLDELHHRVQAAGLRVVQGIEDRPWGRTALYADAAGNRIWLSEDLTRGSGSGVGRE